MEFFTKLLLRIDDLTQEDYYNLCLLFSILTDGQEVWESTRYTKKYLRICAFRRHFISTVDFMHLINSPYFARACAFLLKDETYNDDISDLLLGQNRDNFIFLMDKYRLIT